jgi:hypothetical protein
MLCACRYMSLDQQVWVIKQVGSTNQLETCELISDDPIKRLQNNRGSTLNYVGG